VVVGRVGGRGRGSLRRVASQKVQKAVLLAQAQRHLDAVGGGPVDRFVARRSDRIGARRRGEDGDAEQRGQQARQQSPVPGGRPV
jgi:hypothetical protein